MMEVLHSSKTSVLTRATWHNIPQDIFFKVYLFISFQKKKGKDHCNKENTLARKAAALDSSNSNFGLAEDSNTCKFMVFVS
jgi:hypothetical protein